MSGWTVMGRSGPLGRDLEEDAARELARVSGADLVMPGGEPAPREIPAGKILLAEFGDDVNDSNRAQRTVLYDRYVESKRRTYRLVSVSAGFEPAGAVAKWTNGYYAVLYEMGGARHGQQFPRTAEGLEAAEARFALWTAEDGA